MVMYLMLQKPVEFEGWDCPGRGKVANAKMANLTLRRAPAPYPGLRKVQWDK